MLHCWSPPRRASISLHHPNHIICVMTDDVAKVTEKYGIKRVHLQKITCKNNHLFLIWNIGDCSLKISHSPYVILHSVQHFWQIYNKLINSTTWCRIRWEQPVRTIKLDPSGGHQPLFPKWWDNLPPTVQKTARQQHHLCSWGYSHQSGTELLPTHGPSPSRCGSLLWLNVLFAGNWGWRQREPFYLPYHEPALVIEW